MSKINGYLSYPAPNTKTLESFQSIVSPIFHVLCVCKGKFALFQMQATGVEDWERGQEWERGDFCPKANSHPPIHPTSPQPPLLIFNQARIFIERERGLHLETAWSALSYLYFEYKPLN